MARTWRSLLAIAGGATALILAAVTPVAAAPYQDWSQTASNSAGVVYRPNGDYFEIWDNVNGNGSAAVWFHYKDVNDAWKSVGEVWDGHAVVQRNVYENAYIYFHVCDYTGCSGSSLYYTG